MRDQASPEDRAFRDRFEACSIPPGKFDHRGHIRLACVYLCENEPGKAHSRMRRSLQAFLAHYGVAASRYRETVTRAWLGAFHHFTTLGDAADWHRRLRQAAL